MDEVSCGPAQANMPAVWWFLGFDFNQHAEFGWLENRKLLDGLYSTRSNEDLNGEVFSGLQGHALDFSINNL